MAVADYGYPNIDWTRLSEYYNRLTNRVMDQQGLDAILLFCRDNIRIGSGFRTFDQLEMGGSIAEEYALIVDRKGELQIFQPWNEPPTPETCQRFPRVKEWTYIPAWIPEDVTADYWASLIAKKIDRLKAKKVGFDHLSCTLYEKLRQGLGGKVGFQSVFTELLEGRMIKTEEEVKLLEYAADLTDAATEEVIDLMHPGTTEHKIIAEFAKKMYEKGAETMSHLSIGSKKLGAPTARPMRRGDAIMIDTGFYCMGGYSSDEARTNFIGESPSEFKQLYNLLKEALFAATKAMTPGRKCSEIDSLLRKPLLEAGYSDSPYATGHGIGLRLMELPQLDKIEFMAKDFILKENMCIAIEPQAGSEEYRAKLENVIVVKSGGGVSINHSKFLD